MNHYVKQKRAMERQEKRVNRQLADIHRGAARVQDIPTPNIIDRVVGVFRPESMVRRIGARYAAYMMERKLESWSARSAYKAADVNRLNQHWDARNQDVNDYLGKELPRIRARSRWLFRNNPHANSWRNALINYVIGTGIRLQMQARQMVVTEDGDLRAQFLDNYNAYVRDLFNEWGEDVDVNASVSAPESFVNVQQLAFGKLIEDGEYFIHPVIDATNSVVPFRMEIIEPDSLNESMTSYQDNPIKMGVELDANSWKPVAYWIYSARKQSASYVRVNKTLRVPAEEIIHVFPKLRPRQVRGVPLLAAVTQRFFDLDEYTDAELISCQLAAMVSVFIEQAPDQAQDGILEESSGASITDVAGNPISDMQPGMIGKLAPGAKPHILAPQKPGATFDMFTRYQMRSLAAGGEFGMSYTTMTRDTENLSHAGGRLAQLMDFQGFRRLQEWFAAKHCKSIFCQWFDAAVMAGKVTAPGYYTEPGKYFWRRHAWMPGGWHRGVNPLQDAEASVASMRAGITSPDDECAALGLDAEAQLHKIARYRKLANELQVLVESDPNVGRVTRTGEAAALLKTDDE